MGFLVSAAHGELGRDDYLTPPEVVNFGRMALGGPFDLDPFSQHTRNQIVQAERLFTKEDDGLAQEWVCERAMVNPPGGKSRLGQLAWAKLVEEYAAGRCKGALFVAFSTDYLQTTIGKPDWLPRGMLAFPTFLPARRLAYWDIDERGVAFETDKALRPSVLCVLPRADAPLDRDRLTAQISVGGVWI